MKRSGAQIRKLGYRKMLRTVVFVIAMISFSPNSSNARAASLAPSDYRVVTAGGEFTDTTQIAVAFRMRPPRRLRARRLELALGAITTPQETRVFMSLRIQHTSNGGLSNNNPGLDMIGLNIAFNVFN